MLDPLPAWVPFNNPCPMQPSNVGYKKSCVFILIVSPFHWWSIACGEMIQGQGGLGGDFSTTNPFRKFCVKIDAHFPQFAKHQNLKISRNQHLQGAPRVTTRQFPNAATRPTIPEAFMAFFDGNISHTHLTTWAPTSYKWSYNPYTNGLING